MAQLSNTPLNNRESMNFLEKMGFMNFPGISGISVWKSPLYSSFYLHLDPDKTVRNLTDLFTIIYETGYDRGQFEGKLEFKNEIMMKIMNFIDPVSQTSNIKYK